MFTGEERRANFQHLVNLRDDPEYLSQYLNDAVSEKLSPAHSCYPWHPDNVAEAMSNFSASQYLVLSELVKDDCCSVVGNQLQHFILSYWHHMAKCIAEREMNNELV